MAKELPSEPTLPALSAVRVKCSPEDTVGDLKKLIAAQTGTSPEKVSEAKPGIFLLVLSMMYRLQIQLKKWTTVYKDHITLGDCE